MCYVREVAPVRKHLLKMPVTMGPSVSAVDVRNEQYVSPNGNSVCKGVIYSDRTHTRYAVNGNHKCGDTKQNRPHVDYSFLFTRKLSSEDDVLF